MKNISQAMETHLQEEVTSLATCWKLTRSDGAIMGFTDHDTRVTVEEVDYEAETGFTPTAVAASSSLSVDNLDVEGMLEADSITEADIMAGRYDFAEIEIFQVNHRQPEAGRIILRRGWLGEITVRNRRFVAEVRGMTQKLSQQIGQLYSPACRAELGDGRCRVAMGGFTHTGTVAAVASRSIFSDPAREEENGYFSAGKVTFTSGLNAGLSMEVKAFEDGRFTLVLPMPYDVEEGDGYSVRAGCDKNFSTCVSRFDNAANFRGEPHVPGIDRMLETSTTRSQW